jgi:hypothetical protein
MTPCSIPRHGIIVPRVGLGDAGPRVEIYRGTTKKPPNHPLPQPSNPKQPLDQTSLDGSVTKPSRAVPALCLLFASASFAQTPSPILSGVVTDPSGAIIRNATLVLQSREASANPVTTTTDASGRFSITLPPGTYDLSIDTPGFAPYAKTVTIAQSPVRLDAKLSIAANSEQVNVTPDSDSTSAADNKSALIFKQENLQALSGDDATFQQEILAMAGGSGADGAQIYVDGFSNGRFPPKDTIREIRINQNPYSTEYDSLGYGRVEISTKPGSDKLHGDYYASGNDNSFNAKNPYTGSEPPYYNFFTGGDLGGPLGKNTSLFVSSRYQTIQNNALVNAFNADGSVLNQAIPSPSSDTEFSTRLDRQLSKNNTFVGRYEVDHSIATNSGVGLLVLASEGVNTGTTTQTLQASNSWLAGTKVVSDTRFQYIRTRANQTPVSSSPTIVVQGFFNGGGAPGGAFTDNQDNYEFQQYLSLSAGKHFIRTGVRERITRDSNRSTANYNGQFTFTNLAAYQAGTPSQYSVTTGQPSAVVLTTDLGAYGEDEWKVRNNLTLNYGLRIESQTGIPDHFDPAPRAAFAWAVGQTDKHTPWFTLRAGAGLFYTRFAVSNLLTAVRQNGVSQQSFFVTDPIGFPSAPSTAQLTGTAPTPYTISPHLHAATALLGGIGVERSIGKIGNVSVNYLSLRGTHNYNSFNINAPLPGTFVLNDPIHQGVRPMGGTQNIYQFASEGVTKERRFDVHGNLNPNKKLFLWFYETTRLQNADSAGANSFPSQPYNLSADYSRDGVGNHAILERLYTGFDYHLPYAFTVNMVLSAQSGPRFDITTGTDLNGDTIYNDRPAFATRPGPASVLYNTRYGSFDANPQPGEAIIPFNYGHAPGVFFSELGVGRDFKFGPRPAAEPPPPGTPAPNGPIEKPDPKYDLSFEVDASNPLNHVNPGPPVGVLTSPDFGRSISLNPFFSPSTASNRTVFLQTNFRF